MLSALFELLVPRSDRLAAQLAGYGELVVEQAGLVAVQVRQRAWLLGGLIIGGAAGLGLAGMALLLAAALPVAQMPLPGLLLAVPALPLLVAAGCGLALWSRPMNWGMGAIGARLSADAARLNAPAPPGSASAIQPRALIGRHPLAAMLLAAGAGSALMLLRPWRWQVFSHGWHALRGQLTALLVAQITAVPIEKALSALMAALVPPSPQASPPQDPGPVTAGPPVPSSGGRLSESSDKATASAPTGVAPAAA
jgi:hypothetical protein